ncbi:MAG: diguanylate cyclase [Anaerolineae bacterium]|nr:diguanylate cyclase [Anaerolineae bacterium]MBT7072237.1 diguanylate cyclase [Anaerolineae bacterium]MBT7323985.1 diguanylate cyclase [Anaerolineae bacterium]
MKILIVDDEQIERRIVEKTLARLGHELVVADNGAIAWNFIQEQQIRFVITDWNMPGIDGIQLIQKIRSSELDGYVYVILVTSNDKNEDIVQGLYSGADDYLTKPFNPAELEARVAVGERVLTLEDHLVRAKNQLEKLAMVDSLTGIMNRRAIYKFARGELERARRLADPISVVFLDIDKFKDVNDEHGHLTGDEALKLITQVIKERSRTYDGIGRWAGDEFLVVLPGTSSQDAEKAALRIVEGIAATKLTLPTGGVLPIHASAGVATITKISGAATLLDDIIQLADEALYRAKEAGGNQAQTTRI